MITLDMDKSLFDVPPFVIAPVLVALVTSILRLRKVPWAKSRYVQVVEWVALAVVLIYAFMHAHFTNAKSITQWSFMDYMMALILPAAVFGLLWLKQPAARKRTITLWTVVTALGVVIVTFLSHPGMA
ncbi:MAG: hypothetical protein WBW89_01915 [Candidatus Cybelea sp.]